MEMHRKVALNTILLTSNGTHGFRKTTTIYAVRHGEREDNINRLWRHELYKLSRFEKDDSPLSERGVFQAEECAYRFSKTHFDHVFSSPFDRCMETTARILGGRWTKIKVEPGLAEILCMCMNPAGFRDVGSLRKDYVNIDTRYEPRLISLLKVYQRESLNYADEQVRNDSVCLPRVRETLRHILNNYSGCILIVSHGAVIAAIHKVLIGRWCSVGQATVSKFTRIDSGSFVCEYSGDASHLADQTNLRAF
ncbi:unnamed protein product [Enterobius vermicularis]|uniref:Histidine phosphatase family protein n=1 Tax=Enterobius vermicularis TaxID=51028 RepID=A0A0N4VB30_ENTVE|nr:unnamed protein product [Enterobius vermicularis]